MAEEVSTDARPARDGHAALDRRADLAARCARWRSTTSATGRSRSPARRPGSSPTRRHTKARILDVRADRIRAALDEDLIVLVAGFQGVSTAKDVTTLGRGGSDTTAVALAAAMDAEVCEIYTDVAGVFSADPRIVPDARKLPVVSFEEMLEMSASGAGVLQLRSVEYARNHGVRIHCRSSFTRGARYLRGRRRGDDGTPPDHRRDALARRGAGHAARRARPPGRRRPHLHRAGRRQRQRRHDHPERARVRGRAGRHVVHRPALGPAHRARRARAGRRRGRHPRGRRGPGDGQGVGRRRGNEVAPRRRRARCSPRSATRGSTSR